MPVLTPDQSKSLYAWHHMDPVLFFNAAVTKITILPNSSQVLPRQYLRLADPSRKNPQPAQFSARNSSIFLGWSDGSPIISAYRNFPFPDRPRLAMLPLPEAFRKLRNSPVQSTHIIALARSPSCDDWQAQDRPARLPGQDPFLPSRPLLNLHAARGPYRDQTAESYRATLYN
jgi:hypothetical protein